jgi:hypothetical protein
VFLTKFANHGGHRGNAMQALVRWQHPVASSEARDVLYQAMRHAPYRRIRMAIKITSNSPAFFVNIDFVTTNCS